MRPWPDAEPTRRVSQRAKTSNPPPDRYDLALGWPVGAFSRGVCIGWTIPRLRCGRNDSDEHRTFAIERLLAFQHLAKTGLC